MAGTWIELLSGDGYKGVAYRAQPAGKPRGGLVVAQEIFGVNAHIRSVCDGFAADGYLAIAPALFERYERGVDLGYTPEDIARGREIRGRVSTDQALADIAAARTVAAEAGKAGVIGYCWGGLLSWLAAARVPGLACAIVYYGGGITDAIGEQPRCPVVAHFGEQDAMIPMAGVKALAAAHPSAQVFTYPAGHGFNCDQRGSFNAESAKLARERSLTFLREYVG
jgi:carboxymethylenebutenolidase